MDFQEANIKVEFVDSMQAVLQSVTVCSENLEKEVRRLAGITERENSSTFHYCRHGEIQRNLGKLKSAMDGSKEV